MNSLLKAAGFVLPVVLTGMIVCPRAQAQSPATSCTDRGGYGRADRRECGKTKTNGIKQI